MFSTHSVVSSEYKFTINAKCCRERFHVDLAVQQREMVWSPRRKVKTSPDARWWLLGMQMQVCVCVQDRHRERERETDSKSLWPKPHSISNSVLRTRHSRQGDTHCPSNRLFLPTWHTRPL